MKQLAELLEKDTFSVWIPNVAEFDFAKADATKGQERRIGGYCSTQTRDRQGEILVQKGLDFSEFVEAGYFNDNHKQDTDAVVGYPESAKYVPGKGWYTEGVLLPNWPLADRIWGLAKSLDGTPRRLGFSVEGKVQERGDGGRITRAIIRNVAITNRPVNTDCTWGVLSKAFASDEEIMACYDKNTGKPCACELPNAVKSLSRSDLDLKKGVKFLQKIRPQYSKELCSRIYSFASTL